MWLAIYKPKSFSLSWITNWEIKGFLISVPEIVEVIGYEDAHRLLDIQHQDLEVTVKDVLMSVFMKLMFANTDHVSDLLSKLRDCLTAANKERILTEIEWLALELANQYLGDIGVISSSFFNYVKLQPGEALYLDPNEPHAYISGECIECMATSDNVAAEA